MTIVCRLCLKFADSSSYTIIKDGQICSENIIQQVQTCIPEMNLDLIKESIMCTPCTNLLYNFYCFKNSCLESEKLIHNYMQETEISLLDDLNGVYFTNRLSTQNQQNAKDPDTTVDQIVQVVTIKTETPNDDTESESRFDYSNEQTASDGKKPQVKEETNVVTFVHDTPDQDENESCTNNCVPVKIESIETPDSTVARSTSDISDVEPNAEEVQEHLGGIGTTEEKLYFVKSLKKAYKNLCNRAKPSSLSLEKNIPNVQEHSNHNETNLLNCTAACDNQPTENVTAAECFLCGSCEDKFESKSQLDAHVQLGCNKVFNCYFCTFTCLKKSSFKLHLQTHNTGTDKPFQCLLCNFKTLHKNNLKAHLLIHTGEKPFQCEYCEYKCSQRSYLRKHLPIHTGEKPYKCDVCDAKFSKPSRLKRHLANHTGDKPFQCEYCDYKCTHNCDLKKHIRKHTGEKPFQCEVCNCRFAHKSHLVRHLAVHTGEKPFVCDYCGYRTSDRSKLKEHLPIHTGEKPFQCEICEYRCSRKPQLKRHARSHTGEKPFSCNLCDYKGSDRSNLRKHILTHNEVQRYKCMFCDYKFAKRSQLQRHTRKHTGEKPLKCEYCDYRCAWKTQIVRHLRIHTGEKPFSCEFCDYKCSQKGHLTRHLEVHKKKDDEASSDSGGEPQDLEEMGSEQTSTSVEESESKALIQEIEYIKVETS